MLKQLLVSRSVSCHRLLGTSTPCRETTGRNEYDRGRDEHTNRGAVSPVHQRSETR